MEQFEECSRHASFVELPREAVAELIGSDDLPCAEEAVVAAVRAWFDHDAAGRAGALKSLVPLIRWSLLPVAAQLQLKSEPLMMSMLKQDDECLELGVSLLLECNSGFAKSDGAAACPRLKRRKGSVEPVSPLGITVFRQEYYTVSEDGALLSATEDADDQAAICRDFVMNNGQSCAEFTVVQVQDMTIGVARPTLDVTEYGAPDDPNFWGVHNSGGHLFHDRDGHYSWQGMQSYAPEDVLRRLLDSDAGTLTVKKNGTLLGVAVTEGLTGDLRWAVCCASAHNSLRLKAVDPAEF